MKTQKTLISIAAGLLLSGGVLLTAPAQAQERHHGARSQVHHVDHRAANREWRRAPRWEHRAERRAWRAHRHHERRWWREQRRYRDVYYAPPRHYDHSSYRVQFYFSGN
ncbi:MAG: hypothetical protein P8090_16665 [Gammaproteobacteria bacterium]